MKKYPDLSDARVVCFDIETYDPELGELGPGVYRRDGNVLGVALATEDWAEYYPVGKLGTPGREKNLRYVSDVLGATESKKLGVNILYDMDWLQNFLGVSVRGELHDVQIAEPLINENAGHYSLEALAQRYCGREKRIDLLRNWCIDHNLRGDPRAHIWEIPESVVREYALEDVRLPIEIFRKQWEILRSQDLLPLYHLEMKLFPMLLDMRRVGIRISEERVEAGITHLRQQIRDKSARLWVDYGKFNYNSSRQVAKVFDRLGIAYPLTEKDNPNLDNKVLKFRVDHPIAKQIIELKEMDKILSTFFVNSFSAHNVGGRIHCQFHPNKTDESGTKSGRLSSTDPNLQQIPSREETYGALCRSVFLPEEGHVLGRRDWNQIEYRLIAHYGQGEGADRVRERYRTDPRTDYHQMIMDLTGLERKRAKVLNFGMAYMMGVEKMHRQFGWPVEECRALINLYNREVPFIRETRNWVSRVARSRGYVRTILRRRARLTPDMVRLHKEYQMFNRLIQGSAADIMKKSMVDIWEAGICRVLPHHLTVHDELVFSIPPTREGVEACAEHGRLMEKVVELSVPILSDLRVGPSWGEVREFDGTVEGLTREEAPRLL